MLQLRYEIRLLHHAIMNIEYVVIACVCSV